MNRKNDHEIFYGWKIVIVSLALTTTSFGVLYAFGIFFKNWMSEWGCSRAFLSGVFSIAFVVYGIASFFMGNLTDRFGPRKTIACGGLIMGMGAVSTALLSIAWPLYLTFGLMIGVGVGTSYSPTAATVSRWFVEKKGMALGIVVAGLGAGPLIYSPLARFLIASTDWRITFICFGIIIWIVFFTAAWVIRKEPSDIGLEPYGVNKFQSRRYMNEKKMEASNHVIMTNSMNTLSALRKPYFWILFFVHCTWVLGMVMPMVHIVPYATDIGILPGKAAVMLGLIGGVSILGRLVLGGIGEWIETRKMLLLLLIFQSTSMIWLSESNRPWMIWTFVFSFGFSYGGIASLFPIITIQYFGILAMGSIFGLILLGATIGGVTGPFLAGLIFDYTNEYYWGFIIGAGSMAIGAVITCFLPSINIESQISS